MNVCKIAIVGATGRMGKMLIEAVLSDPKFQLVAAIDRTGNGQIGQDAGLTLGKNTGVMISDNLNLLAKADCLIDFTRPEGTLTYLKICLDFGIKMVIGTTGFDLDQKNSLKEASQKIPMVMSPNMSVGVNVTYALLSKAAALLPHYDTEVFELHHRHKVDAPSGTALRMGEVIAQARGQDFSSVADFARHGNTGERQKNSVGFSVARGGDVVGDHHVMFLGEGERIEIRHQSTSRSAYAKGSLLAAAFLQHKNQGLFDMFDVLNLRA